MPGASAHAAPLPGVGAMRRPALQRAAYLLQDFRVRGLVIKINEAYNAAHGFTFIISVTPNMFIVAFSGGSAL